MIYRPNSSGYTETEHTADIAIRVRGDSYEQLFSNALFGMYHTLLGDTNFNGGKQIAVKLEEFCYEDLLVSWLSEMNYHLMTNNFMAGEIQDMSIQETGNTVFLSAVPKGRTDKRFSEMMDTEIKAVTYHQLDLSRKSGGFSTLVIFDI
jgi:SHS2 domain-containing protein